MSEDPTYTHHDDPGGSGPRHRADRREASAIELSIASHVTAGRTVMRVEGELDLYTAPSLRDAILAEDPSGSGPLVLDLTAVPFMDSSGLGVIVACLKHLREAGGDLALITTPGSPPTKLLSLTGLDRAIPTFASVEDAIR